MVNLRYKIKSKDVNFFHKNGYILVRNIFDRKNILLVKKSINSALLKIFNKKYPKLKKLNFHKKLIILRKKKPKSFSILFDTLQTSSSLYNLINEKLILTVSKLLKQKKHNVTMTDIGIRLDPPNDNRNTLAWHQDSSYYRQNNSGKNGLVVWSPVIKLEKNMGPLEFIKDSYKIGTLNVKKKKSKKKFGSSKREIKSENLKKFKKILTSNVNVGDALIINLDMVHRSGINSSQKVRVTFLSRFHNMMASDFNPGLNLYKYSDKNLNYEIHGF